MFRQDREEELVLPYSCISSQIVADTDTHTDTGTNTDTDTDTDTDTEAVLTLTLIQTKLDSARGLMN